MHGSAACGPLNFHKQGHRLLPEYVQTNIPERDSKPEKGTSTLCVVHSSKNVKRPTVENPPNFTKL